MQMQQEKPTNGFDAIVDSTTKELHEKQDQGNEILGKIYAVQAELNAKVESLTEEQRTTLEHFRGKYITLDTTIAEPIPLITYKGEPFICQDERILIYGQSKCFKTTFTSMLIASAISSKPIGNFAHVGTNRVLWFDTEQNTSDSAKTKARIAHLCNVESDAEKEQFEQQLIYVPLSEERIEDRLQIIANFIAIYEPQIVVIDLLTDLMSDFNSIAEAQNLSEQIKNIARQTKVAFVLVQHQNEGDRADMRAMGHSGGTFTRKAERILHVSYSDAKRVVSVNSKMRSTHLGELQFSPMTINYHGISGAVLNELSEQEKQAPTTKAQLQESMVLNMCEGKNRTTKELTDALLNGGFDITSKGTARNKISEMAQSGLIKQVARGIYSLPNSAVQDNEIPIEFK
jgi:hypothetical protein